MVVFPHAKINIGLKVIRRRADGYHDLETLFYPVGWSDILEIVPGKKETMLHLSGMSIAGDPEENLCMKAYRMLANEYPLPPLEIYLHKLVPAGAGLGGGSSDAAHTLKLINSLFAIGLSETQLEKMAGLLGSDCPFFIRGLPCLATGRGEVMQPVSLSLCDYHILLVVPPIHVSTREAYAGVTPQEPGSRLEDLLLRPVEQWKESVSNDFEKSVFENHPGIAQLKKRMYKTGAVYASMSGSGSAVFGLYTSDAFMQERWDGCLVYTDRIGQHP